MLSALLVLLELLTANNTLYCNGLIQTKLILKLESDINRI